ncbi:MAG TPA: DUF5916 domain-containing protein [Vicinamibacteria bacterium]|nr:DUF5916 domain-containing protein [Vicinamibacteria bacterium]
MRSPRQSGRLQVVPVLLVALGLSRSAASWDEVDGPPPPAPPAVVARDAEGRVTVRATRVREPVIIDGVLDDPVYHEVEAIAGFVQQEPHEGAPATEKTEVWMLFDSDNVYVSARCWDSHPERMVGNEMRRDHQSLSRNENFGVAFDTFHDRRNSFMFHVNLLGGLTDALAVDERNVNKDWNTIWNARTGRFDSGWTVEMAIPFKSLRFRTGDQQIWGVNFRRIVQWKNEVSYLTPIPASYDLRGLVKVSSAANLVGLEPASARNLEIKPYGITTMRTDRIAEPAIENDLGADAGFDVKYGLTRSLVADVTVNTDFAQVEDDELQVNLTRFDIQFPEKREFFLEGQGVFAFGNAGFGGGGGGGSGGPPSNTPVLFFSRRIGISDYGEVPIRAGARVTGKIGSYTLGALNIHTDGLEGTGIEPTGFSVFRLKRDIFRKSQVGMILTHRSQSVVSDGSNQAFGVDASFGLSDSLVVGGYYAATHTPELSGGEEVSYRGIFDYNADLYGARVSHTLVGENFNPEIGFLRREDFRETVGKFRLSRRRPGGVEWIRKVSLEPGIEYVADTLGRLESRQAQMTFRMEIENGDEWSVDYEKNFEFLPEPFEIAPGVILPVDEYRFDNVRLAYRLGPQRKVSGRVSAELGGFYGGTRREIGYEGRIETSPRLGIEPNVSVNRVSLPEGDFTATLLGGRITFNMSPRMSLSALVQYASLDSEVLTNVRLRWEYLPGSDFFVVYSDGRTTALDDPLFLQSRSFAVKLTRLVRF